MTLSRSITEIQVRYLVKCFCVVSGGVKLVNGILKVSCDEYFIVVLFVRFKCQFMGNLWLVICGWFVVFGSLSFKRRIAGVDWK